MENDRNEGIADVVRKKLDTFVISVRTLLELNYLGIAWLVNAKKGTKNM